MELGSCNKDRQTCEVESERKKGIADVGGGKACSFKRLAGSQFLKILPILKKMRSELWLFKPSERLFKMAAGSRDRAAVFIGGFSSFLRAGAACRSARDLSL